MLNCPYCGEPIRETAIICRHCEAVKVDGTWTRPPRSTPASPGPGATNPTTAPGNAPPPGTPSGRSILTVVALWTLAAVGLVAVICIAAVTFLGKPAEESGSTDATSRTPPTTTDAPAPIPTSPPTSFVNTDPSCVAEVAAVLTPTRDDMQTYQGARIAEAEARLAQGSERLRGLNAGLVDAARTKLNVVTQVYDSIGTRTCPKVPTADLVSCIRTALSASTVPAERTRIETSEQIISSTGANLPPEFADVYLQEMLGFLERYQTPDVLLAAQVLECDPDAPPMTPTGP